MATHTVQIVSHKQLSDGQLALLAECCSDPKTHSYLTMAAEVILDDAQCQDAINFHCQRVATLHESMQRALSKAHVVLGSKFVMAPTASAAPAAVSATVRLTTSPDSQAPTIQ